MQTQQLIERIKRSKKARVLWLNTSPSFQCFDRPLVDFLSKYMAIAQWQYCQSEDEPSSLEIALVLLHDYIKTCPEPVHLIGHGTSGLLALLYARKHPERVKSLTLLGVGFNPGVNWQAHYYAFRKLFPSNRETILTQMVYNLFGYQDSKSTKKLVGILQKDLDLSPNPHSLFRRKSEVIGGICKPLMVCGSEDDLIVDPNALNGWKKYLKEGDRLWKCQEGHHFFYYFYPEEVGKAIMEFWQFL